MSWYQTGTVAVTNGNTTVTGTGTAFVGAVRAGWAFIGPDGRIYRIASVVSNTSLTISPGYLGTTQSGQTYAIFPTQGLEAGLTTALQALLTSVQGTVDGPGQGKFADGSAGTPGMRFSADEDTGLHRPAANQIGLATGGTQRALLSNTALLVNVPITGTAVTANATDTTAGRVLRVGAGHQQLDPALYRRGNIVGTVTESSGLPTGAVIEHGSNANGRFTRFADGTQICWRSASINLAAGATANFNIPATFVGGGDEVALSISWRESSVDGGARAMCTIETGSSAFAWTVRNNSATGFSGARTALFMAIGRWF